ncbi:MULTISPECIES: AAA family ATPase [Flavobacteriaceae]|jgi:cobaltochelatase CobS|uniref:AAA family ATPase n=1 Tax=Dokdonia ponticola TaxID=2041041 RepID=A0ABV9HRQ1_9FLAO|nr:MULTISPECIES: AAA family ATPase [Flavobacteriaceae]MAM22662.1 ATPase [Croceibacter sp.]MCD9620365.1 AAA family ATPase [Tenacibaculum maritimum]MCD9626712.1 AAA family ATPase [Tenacibaculum maritimum]MCD9629109.1 AAA family ATPase [Tenacibaculum maritimum]MCD9632522.1 AAA family ATPase [Tenacibaculum maritimum]
MTQRKLDIPEVQQIPQFMKIMDDLSVGNNPYLVGSAGTGKTTLGEKVAYAINGRSENDGKELPFTIVNCNQWTSPIDIKGGQTISGYKEGALIEAWRDGKILILDEMPKLDANTAGLLNDALAKSAREDAIIFNGQNEPIVKHRGFGCIATGNVIGKGASGNYVGNNKQDASLLDRFSGSIYRIGFNETLERQLVYAPVVNMCIDIRKAILRYEGKEAGDDDTEDIMTLRTMLNLERAYELEMKRETGMKDEFGKTYRKMPNGKTLKDALESYFIAMNREKAEHIKTEVNLEGFLNSYKGSVMKAEFIKEFKRRIG